MEEEPIHSSIQAVKYDVWPDLAPGETASHTGRRFVENGIVFATEVARPQLFYYPAPGNGPHPVIIVCPGGGYNNLAYEHEGVAVAQWLNSFGVTAFVLHYRVPVNRAGALQDIQRAVSLVRSNTIGHGIAPEQVGVLGFSAGGHLCATLAAAEERTYDPVDKADESSCRPDFALLIYPAYLANSETGVCSPEVAPHAGMPPVFITQTRDDVYYNADPYIAAFKAAGIPLAAEIYEVGGHGYGLALPDELPAHEWPQRAADWIKAQTL